MRCNELSRLRALRWLGGALVALIASCASAPIAQLDHFEIIDCEIPGAVIRIGTGYATTGRSQALRTSGSDCAIRGGYFTEANAANYATSLKVWQPIADAGDAQAQFYVGRIYDSGLGRTPDVLLASVWYKKAADQGHTAALTALAGLHEKGGIDGQPNPSAALELYRRAARLTEPLAFARDVTSRDAEIEALKRELGNVKREAERESENLKRSVEQRNSELSRLRQDARRIASAAPRTPQAASAERRVSESEAELQRETRRLAAVQADAQRAQAAANAIDARTANTDGPRIELIEPASALMRGLTTVRIASGVAEIAVAARITARAPLAAVTLNEQPLSADANGVVRTKVSIKGSTTPVQIVAADAQGRRAVLAFVVATDAVLPDAAVASGASFGNYHALVVGNSRYREWDSLNSPRHDATAIASVLRSRYGFQVRTLFDATRQDIIRELARMRTALGPRDNLLVYYAGHGFWDSANQRGYWIPVDGGKKNPANWVSSTDITDQLSVIPAKQVLVVADSCYSGVLVGSVAAQLDRAEGNKGEWLARRAQMRSRKVMSSGNIAQVMDGGAGNNSIFARQLLNALSQRAEPFEAHELFREVAPRVEQAARGSGAQQEPQYGQLRHAGHEAGDFVFVPKI
jgi:TPR repeat protein